MCSLWAGRYHAEVVPLARPPIPRRDCLPVLGSVLVCTLLSVAGLLTLNHTLILNLNQTSLILTPTLTQGLHACAGLAAGVHRALGGWATDP